MSMLSFAYYPVVPVSPYFSEPAKSTSYSLLTVTPESPTAASFTSWDSTVRQNIVWDLEDVSFKLWEASILFLEPSRNSSIASSAD